MDKKNNAKGGAARPANRRWAHVASLLTAFCILFSLAFAVNGRVFGNAPQEAPAPADDPVARVLPDGAVVINTTTLGSDVQGYAGTVPLEVTFRDGVIEDVKALDNVETPSFFERAWNGLKLVWSDEEAASVAKRDIDAVSGATYSSQAIIENLRRAVNYYMEHYQHTEAAANAGISGLGAAWWGALLVALASAILPFFIHNRMYRFIQLVLNVGVLGFWTGTFLSYTSFLSVFSNPVRLAMLPTMILLVTAFIVPLFGAGNRYCTWTCPFGSMQMLAGMAVKHKPHIGHRTVMALTWVRRGLWTVLMLLTWTGVFSEWIDYEIFTAFLVSSVPTFMLIIAGAFVLLSFVVERPFCRFVCPTGTIINISEINY